MLYFAYFVIYAFVIAVGVTIGSFLNVLIYRLPRKIDFKKGRSFCPNCGHNLVAYDLVPVFSWAFLCGKCRYCKNKISFRYPLVELLGGLLAVLCVITKGFTIEAVIGFPVSCVLLTIAFIDWDTMEIPDGLTLFLIIPAILSVFFMPQISILSRIIGIFIISVPMFILNLFIADSFGGGDIKLCLVMGFFLGAAQMVVGTFIALLTAGIYAVYLLKTKKKGRKEHFALGPFLSLGMVLSFLFGNSILNCYLSLFM